MPLRVRSPVIGEAHVWVARVDVPPEQIARLDAVVTGEERARAQRFRFQVLRDRFSATRAIRRLILAHYLDADPQRLTFVRGPRGKPELVADGSGGLRFNESETQGLALFALTRVSAVGVDVESVRPFDDADRIVEMFASGLERQLFRHIPAGHRNAAFLRWWTGKEAYVKAVGTGLYQDLDTYSVSFDSPLRLLEADAGDARRWSLVELRPAPGFTAALVVEGGPLHLRLLEWTDRLL